MARRRIKKKVLYNNHLELTIVELSEKEKYRIQIQKRVHEKYINVNLVSFIRKGGKTVLITHENVLFLLFLFRVNIFLNNLFFSMRFILLKSL